MLFYDRPRCDTSVNLILLLIHSFGHSVHVIWQRCIVPRPHHAEVKRSKWEYGCLIRHRKHSKMHKSPISIVFVLLCLLLPACHCAWIHFVEYRDSGFDKSIYINRNFRNYFIQKILDSLFNIFCVSNIRCSQAGWNRYVSLPLPSSDCIPPSETPLCMPDGVTCYDSIAGLLNQCLPGAQETYHQILYDTSFRSKTPRRTNISSVNTNFSLLFFILQLQSFQFSISSIRCSDRDRAHLQRFYACAQRYASVYQRHWQDTRIQTQIWLSQWDPGKIF